MYEWITNWLIIGLALNWGGLMVQKYAPHKVVLPGAERVRWWMEIAAICLWPFAFAMGAVAAIVAGRRKR